MLLKLDQSRGIVDRLKSELDPVRIYLFGSQAKGTASEHHSDIDLCVVVPDDNEPAVVK